MNDKELWVLFFHAFVSRSDDISLVIHAAEADEALEIYKDRFGDTVCRPNALLMDDEDE